MTVKSKKSRKPKDPKPSVYSERWKDDRFISVALPTGAGRDGMFSSGMLGKDRAKDAIPGYVKVGMMVDTPDCGGPGIVVSVTPDYCTFLRPNGEVKSVTWHALSIDYCVPDPAALPPFAPPSSPSGPVPVGYLVAHDGCQPFGGDINNVPFWNCFPSFTAACANAQMNECNDGEFVLIPLYPGERIRVGTKGRKPEPWEDMTPEQLDKLEAEVTAAATKS